MSGLVIPNKPKGFKLMSIVFGNGKNTNSRNSRDVHKFLGVTTDYSNWIKRRIDSQGATENIDYTVAKNGVAKKGDFQRIDYIVTDDFAKHLGMIEKNEKGYQVRDYFIYMEKLALFLILKEMEECKLNTAKQIESKNSTIKQLKKDRNVYGKKRGHGLETVSFIINDSEAQISKEAFNVLLHEEGLIEKDVCECCNRYDYSANDEFSIAQGNAILIHYDSAINVLEKYNVEKRVDNQLVFSF